MDAAGIDVAILSHTIGGVEGIPDASLAVSTARRVNDFLAAEVASRKPRPSATPFRRSRADQPHHA